MWISIYTSGMKDQQTQKLSLFRTITVPTLIIIRSTSLLAEEARRNLAKDREWSNYAQRARDKAAKQKQRINQ